MTKDTQFKKKRSGEDTCSVKIKDQQPEYIKNFKKKKQSKRKMDIGYKKVFPSG